MATAALLKRRSSLVLAASALRSVGGCDLGDAMAVGWRVYSFYRRGASRAGLRRNRTIGGAGRGRVLYRRLLVAPAGFGCAAEPGRMASLTCSACAPAAAWACVPAVRIRHPPAGPVGTFSLFSRRCRMCSLVLCSLLLLPPLPSRLRLCVSPSSWSRSVLPARLSPFCPLPFLLSCLAVGGRVN